MKNILVIGPNSYIAKAFVKFISQWPEDYSIDMLSVRDGAWKDFSFSKYDSVYHLAGLAHVKETEENKHLYYEIDRDLPIEIAKKAALDGAKQFIFMSSMSVYGMETGVITSETIPSPKTHYGIAKLQAESAISALENEYFKVCILRPPMVYGKECRGNFNGVVSLVKNLPVFPKINNQRSMIYIENLCSFVKKAIDMDLTGLYFPQNSEYMNTTQMATWIAEGLNKRIFISRLMGAGVMMLQPFMSKARKGFGSLIYKETEKFDFDYCIIGMEDSVKQSI